MADLKRNNLKLLAKTTMNNMKLNIIFTNKYSINYIRTYVLQSAGWQTRQLLMMIFAFESEMKADIFMYIV